MVTFLVNIKVSGRKGNNPINIVISDYYSYGNGATCNVLGLSDCRECQGERRRRRRCYGGDVVLCAIDFNSLLRADDDCVSKGKS